MWHALAQLLPLGLAAAVSSVPIMVTLLILVSDKRHQAALPYLLGWVIGAAALVTIATIVAGLLPDDRPRRHEELVGVLQVVVGGALALLGLTALRLRHSESATRLPGWMTRVDSLDSGPAFGVGVALNVRPKALLLMAAAGLILHTASLVAQETVIAIVFFTVVATSTVMAPVLLTYLAPARTEPRLVAARRWLEANGPAVTAITMLVIGILVILLGLTHL
jgi:hypothetical protein